MPSHRLPPRCKPTRYRIELDVDPAASLRFRGQVRIDVELARGTRTIELHAAELRVPRARVVVAGRALRARVLALPEQERVRLTLPERIERGSATIELAFSGRLRRDLRGLYFVQSGRRRFAFTQLEAADARRFFPCFDEPSFKARFELCVTTAAEHTLISNARQRSSRRLPRGKKRVSFAPTPPISTYLVALAVGPLSGSRAVHAGRTPIRVWHAPGNAGLTGFALDAARRCLLALERYFGIPYPYGKLDLVAVPEFEMGAMENVGAVFFRDNLLLLDERRASLAERKRALEVICHELAHMWYGNLVTMAWWDDLWLNEAFATWMAFAIVDRMQPELRMWNDFGHGRSSAFELDALSSTHPIYARVRTPAEASQSFDLITYEKGAAVIRMLERYLGRERFRRGVRDYVRRHREGNAEARDLWRALAAHAGAAVDAVMRPWVERPGFPLVRVQRSVRRGRQHVRLRQERFAASGRRVPAAPWPVPLVLSLTTRRGRAERRHLLTGRTASLTLAPGERLLYPNADEGGFYRVQLEADLLRELLARPERLRASERLGLVTHVWATVRAGHAPLSDLLDLTLALHAERDPDVLSALHGPLAHVLDQVAPHAGTDARTRLQHAVARAFAPALDALGATPGAREDHASRQRRGELLGLCAVLGEHAPHVELALGLCRRYLRAPEGVDANLVPVALVVGARGADVRMHQRLLRASERAPTPQERRRLRLCLAEHRDAAAVERALRACLRGPIPSQDVALVLARMLHNPHARDAAWHLIRTRFGALRQRIPPLLMSRLIDATPALGSAAARRQVAAHFRRHPVPTATRALAQADERFALGARLRAAGAPALTAWLDTHAP